MHKINLINYTIKKTLKSIFTTTLLYILMWQPELHAYNNSAQKIPLNTLIFFDLEKSKETIYVGDTVEIKGKVFVCKNWNNEIDKPTSAFLNLKIKDYYSEEPIFLAQKLTLGDQSASQRYNFKLGKTYDFSAKLIARKAGSWNTGFEVILNNESSISSPTTKIMVLDRVATDFYPTQKSLNKLLKSPIADNLSGYDLNSKIKINSVKAKFYSEESTLTLDIDLKNDYQLTSQLVEINIASLSFLNSKTFIPVKSFNNDFVFRDGLAYIDNGIIRPGENRIISLKLTSKKFNEYDFEQLKDLNLLITFVDINGEKQTTDHLAYF